MRVAIIGGGVYGYSIAWRLLQAGQSVTLFEQHGALNPHSSSHGLLRIYRHATFEGDAYCQLMNQSRKLWHELEISQNTSLVNACGCIYIGKPDSELIRESQRVAGEQGIEVRLGGKADIPWSQFDLKEDEVWILEEGAGMLYSDECVRSLRMASLEMGLDERIQKVENLAEIESEFDAVIIAAGRFTNDLLGKEALPLEVTEQTIAWCSADGPSYFPVFAHETDTDFIYGFPPTSGNSLMKVGRHNTVDPGNSELNKGDQIAARAQTLFPNTVTGLAKQETCYYTNTPDHHFIVDWFPNHAKTLVVSCCSGHGFKYAPAIAEHVASTIHSGSLPDALKQFSLNRF
ncbi:MAG: FAD-dependent oxidoreductase [Fimbriimonadaceae bacterium]